MKVETRERRGSLALCGSGVRPIVNAADSRQPSRVEYHSEHSEHGEHGMNRRDRV